MNSTRLSALGLLMLAGMAAHVSAQTQPDVFADGLVPVSATVLFAQNTLRSGVPPTNNTIRRINPNSRQGTGPAPGVTRPGSTLPNAPRPSLENSQIGNGYPRSPPLPQTQKPTAPSSQPKDQR